MLDTAVGSSLQALEERLRRIDDSVRKEPESESPAGTQPLSSPPAVAQNDLNQLQAPAATPKTSSRRPSNGKARVTRAVAAEANKSVKPKPPTRQIERMPQPTKPSGLPPPPSVRTENRQIVIVGRPVPTLPSFPGTDRAAVVGIVESLLLRAAVPPGEVLERAKLVIDGFLVPPSPAGSEVFRMFEVGRHFCVKGNSASQEIGQRIIALLEGRTRKEFECRQQQAESYIDHTFACLNVSALDLLKRGEVRQGVTTGARRGIKS